MQLLKMHHHIYDALGPDTYLLLDGGKHPIPQLFNPLGQNRMLTEQDTDYVLTFVQKFSIISSHAQKRRTQ